MEEPCQWGRTGGWAPVWGRGAGARARGCLYTKMPAELVKKVVDHSGWRAEELGEGMVRLMGGRRTRGVA